MRNSMVSESTIAKAREFYAKNDPETVARLRMKLIQAGFMEPGAVGYFFVTRFALLAIMGVGAFAWTNLMSSDVSLTSRGSFVVFSAAFGYFLPIALAWTHGESETHRIPQRFSRLHGFDDCLR